MPLTQVQPGMLGTPQPYNFKNRIINGAMVIDQRNNGASVTADPGIKYSVDRFFIVKDAGTTGVMTAQQSSTAPAGFTNSVKLTTTTAQASLAATDYVRYSQNIEGYNVADLGFGTANAKTVTLSFWVQSSLTGTFGGSLGNSAWNRTYPFTYTISSANTWEYKTITIAGDTSGTWLTTNGIGLRVDFGLGVGSTYSGTAGAWASSLFISATGATSVIGTLNSTWYITGVQLEVGVTATGFDYRPYGTELQLCQRYCNVYGEGVYSVFSTMAFAFSSTGFTSITPLPVEMRAMPTVAYTGNTRGVSATDSIAVTSVILNTSNTNKKIVVCEPSVASGLTVNRGYIWSSNNDASARVIFSAEL
jgi:hypothetical protein